VAEKHEDDARAELDAHLEWLGERVGRPNYRGCPQINVPRSSRKPTTPRAGSRRPEREMRGRLNGIAGRLGVRRPEELAGRLALLINGAFVSSQIFEPGEATSLLRHAAHALIAAAGSTEGPQFPCRKPPRSPGPVHVNRRRRFTPQPIGIEWWTSLAKFMTSAG
jgi:hypothetical protein